MVTILVQIVKVCQICACASPKWQVLYHAPFPERSGLEKVVYGWQTGNSVKVPKVY